MEATNYDYSNLLDNVADGVCLVVEGVL